MRRFGENKRPEKLFGLRIMNQERKKERTGDGTFFLQSLQTGTVLRRERMLSGHVARKGIERLIKFVAVRMDDQLDGL